MMRNERPWTEAVTWAVLMVASVSDSVAAQVPSITKIHPYHQNLLGNGGFEAWTLGTGSTSIPPELWYPLGNPTGLFSQTNLLFKRIAGDCVKGSSGDYSMEATSLMPGGYVAQTLPNHLEFCGEWVTFAVDLSTPFPLGQPTIEIYDGVGATSVTEQVVAGTFRRLTVSHRVDDAATTLEFRIVPDPAVQADNAQVVLGKVGQAVYVPPQSKEPALDVVPLGVVIDWWRFDPMIPVPDGFAICDGAAIVDPLSPFRGMPAPDLSGRFVKAVTSVGLIGTTGGSSTVDLVHSHGMAHTHSGTTDTAEFVPSGTDWNSTGVGYGTYHTHTFATGQPSAPSTQPGLGVTSIEPPFVGLLKLIRIR